MKASELCKECFNCLNLPGWTRRFLLQNFVEKGIALYAVGRARVWGSGKTLSRGNPSREVREAGPKVSPTPGKGLNPVREQQRGPLRNYKLREGKSVFLAQGPNADFFFFLPLSICLSVYLSAIFGKFRTYLKQKEWCNKSIYTHYRASTKWRFHLLFHPSPLSG